MKVTAGWKWGAVGAVLALSGCVSSGTAEQNQTLSGTATDQNSTTAQTNTTGTGGAKGQLTGAGATFPYPIYSKWFDTYGSKNGVQINYQSIGSGGGIQQLKAGTVDFGASDAPLKADDEKAMPGPVVHIPTVGGSVANAYNLPGVQSLKLDGPTLANIYLGKVKKWDDPSIAALNAGAKLPSTTIAVAHRADGSGTTNIFTTYLKTVSPEWGTKVGSGKAVSWPTGVGGKGNEGVTGVVKQQPGGIGYVELNYAIQNKLSVASLKNKDGQFVEPTVDSTTAAIAGGLPALQKDIKAPLVNEAGAKAYPIVGLTYILVYKQQKDPAKGKALTGFLKWAMADGQSMAKDLAYAPLPAEVIKMNATAIDAIK
ncbi:MAG: phosphate ABC transporter substrate-binding protein PstS [Abitibacteriaceae bacterium]|nr:phosphate ABC transporter substrate-binding protein PstS [Abditibacteriaceae bacterium]